MSQFAAKTAGIIDRSMASTSRMLRILFMLFSFLLGKPLIDPLRRMPELFSPIHRFGKFGVLRSRWRLCRLTDAACPLRVHKVRLHFPNLDSTKNLSVSTLEDTISGFPILFILRPCSVQKISAKPNGRAAKKQPDRKLHGRHGVFGKLLHRGAGRRHPTRPQEENTRSCAAGTHPLPRIGHKKTAERIDRLSPQPIRAK